MLIFINQIFAKWSRSHVSEQDALRNGTKHKACQRSLSHVQACPLQSYPSIQHSPSPVVQVILLQSFCFLLLTAQNWHSLLPNSSSLSLVSPKLSLESVSTQGRVCHRLIREAPVEEMQTYLPPQCWGCERVSHNCHIAIILHFHTSERFTSCCRLVLRGLQASSPKRRFISIQEAI